MKKKLRRLMGTLLGLVMALGLMSGISLTVYAGTSYGNYLVKQSDTADTLPGKLVKFNNMDWYIIADNSTALNAGTVTLFAKDKIADSICFNENNADGHVYENSYIWRYLGGLIDSPSFASVVETIAETNLENVDGYTYLYLLSVDEAKKLPKAVRQCSNVFDVYYNFWWLRSEGSEDDEAAFVDGDDGTVSEHGITVTSNLGVRPALNLDLSKVLFSSVKLSGGANAAASGGSASQNYFDVSSARSAMTPVTYKANSGYKFPAASSLYTTTNGITVSRTSDTVVTVSGIPEGAASITVPDAVHAHDFTYSAGGATITAKCGNAGCNLTGSKSTLTIAAPTRTSYGGSGNETATLNDLTAFNTVTGNAIARTDIKYVVRDGTTCTESSTAPLNAGKYTAKITLKNIRTSAGANRSVTASIDYTITPAAIGSVAVSLGKPQAPFVMDGRASVDTPNVTLVNTGIIIWSPALSDGKAAYATAYTATVTAKAAANYVFADAVTATVNGKAATVKKNQDGTLSISYTFGKTEKRPPLVVTPTVTPTPEEAETQRVTPTPIVTPKATPTPAPKREKAKMFDVLNTTKGALIQWDEATDVTGYVVYCYRKADGLRKVKTIKDPNVTECYDTKIKTGCWGRVYHYYVRNLYGKKEGPKSDKMALVRIAPMKITSLTSPEKGVVKVTYKCTVKDNKATGYTIGYALSKSDLINKCGTYRTVNAVGRDTLSKTLRDLKRGYTYYFNVRAYVRYTNSATKKQTKSWSSYSSYSSIQRVKTASSPDSSVPVYQKMKSVQNSPKGILVKWEMSENAEEYAVFRRDNEGGDWEQIAKVSGWDRNSYLDKSVKDQNGRTFYYTVRGMIGSKMSAFDQHGKAIVRLLAPGLKAESSEAGTASLVWSLNGAASGYEIQYSTSKNFKNSKTVTISSGKKKNAVIKNLQSGEKWYFRVRSYRKTGSAASRSGWSPVKSIAVK